MFGKGRVTGGGVWKVGKDGKGELERKSLGGRGLVREGKKGGSR